MIYSATSAVPTVVEISNANANERLNDDRSGDMRDSFVHGTPSLTDFGVISTICAANVPGWDTVMKDSLVEIEVHAMLEGLSNQLYRVSLPSGIDIRDSPVEYRTVLFRVYGMHVSSFYEPSLELEVFKTVSHFGIGPRMISHGPGWRIEEFYENHSVVNVRSLPDPAVYLQVAKHLGKLHRIHDDPEFPESLLHRPPVSFDRLESWRDAADRVLKSREVATLSLELLSEIDAMKVALGEGMASGKLGYHVVFAHNDVQENNMLRDNMSGTLRLIDFEYADMNFQGADIGNFFGEFTMDYLVSDAPFFSGDSSSFPSLNAQQEFAQAYLFEYLGREPRSTEVVELLDSVNDFRQLSHLLWGLWAIVRSQQKDSPETGSFGFSEYAEFRFTEYFCQSSSLGIK